MILQILLYEDSSRSFPWMNVTNPTYYPTVIIVDLDGDGKEEMIVVLTTGYGTGSHIEEIHVLNMEDLSEQTIEGPWVVDYEIEIGEMKATITYATQTSEPSYYSTRETLTFIRENNKLVVDDYQTVFEDKLSEQ